MTTDEPAADPNKSGPSPTTPGLIHAYQAYDPKNFPSPSAPGPDLASAAMEHMMRFGSTRELTPEELARAVKLDPAMFPGLGPSIEALRAMLEARKRKILATYETDLAQEQAARAYGEAGRAASPDKKQSADFFDAMKNEQIAELERLWYRQKDEQSAFSRALLRIMHALGTKYQVDELAAKYTFTGTTALTPDEALEIKEELETIDKLLEQLKEAEKTAQIGIIDLEELAEFADTSQIEGLNRLQKQVEDYLKEEAARQGLEEAAGGFRLTPQAYKIFQAKLLTEVFSDLDAARSGRHSGPIVGEGAVEMQRTRGYEFGDSAANLDVPQSVLNAAARHRGPGPLRPGMDDLCIHQTKNNPKCATVVLLDMSGSMRYNGHYINVKKMGLGLDALIRREYPGDFLRFIELFTFARAVSGAELAALLPKPVSVNNPVVRLRVDMSDPDVEEMAIPQHFTNIQRGLQMARQFLSVQDTPNRQIILITDGLPTAHFEGKHLYMLYPPDPRTEEATMREAHLAAREQITINIFLLPSWSQTSEDVQFAQRMAESTKGRVFFTGGTDLDRFVLWDYVSMRRKIIT